MERFQNPFSLYDFLGYLIPGATMLYGVLILGVEDFKEIGNILYEYNLDGYEDIFLIIVASYITGHIVNFLSSIIIEKYSIWTLGYPSKYLLRTPSKGYFESAFYKGVSSNEYSVRMIARTVLSLIMLPITLLDQIFGKMFYGRLFYARELDEYTSKVIINRIESGIDWVPGLKEIEGDINDQDFFRIIYHYCLENVSSHQSKFQNYVALYGFLRALSVIYLILFWVVLLTTSNLLFVTLIVLGSLSFICYMGYCKFSRRFTLEVLMAYTTIEPPKKPTLAHSNAASFSEMISS